MRMMSPASSVSVSGATARIGDAPELLGVAEIQRGDVVETLAGHDDVLSEKRKAVRLRNEASPQIRDLATVARLERRDLEAEVAARRGEFVVGTQTLPLSPRAKRQIAIPAQPSQSLVASLLGMTQLTVMEYL